MIVPVNPSSSTDNNQVQQVASDRKEEYKKKEKISQQVAPTSTNQTNVQPAKNQSQQSQPNKKVPREPDEEEKKYEENRPRIRTGHNKPSFKLNRTIKKYDTKAEDINVGDIWKVNFPSSKKVHMKSNGDSLESIFHPALVISKGTGDRPISVVEITHKKSNYKVIIGGNYEANCDTMANLNPWHFIKKRSIEASKEELKKVQEKH